MANIDFKKLTDLVTQANDNAQLEAISRDLSVDQWEELLSHIEHHPKLQQKLAPLLVGFQPAQFWKALEHLSEKHLMTLKKEGESEPLQHQLLLFVHHCEQIYIQIDSIICNLKKSIEEILSTPLKSSDLASLVKKIDTFKHEREQLLPAMDNALLLLWNTTRIDLIDKLSTLREQLQRYLVAEIGHPRTHQEDPSGLYLFLEESLKKIYDGFPEKLEDDEPAIDGLAKFSIWYLKDYWEIGLLPQIKGLEELELDPKKHDEAERVSHHQNLLKQVQTNLQRLKIGTVGDLKKAQIFSKSMLKDYISSKRQIQHLH